MNKKYLYMMLGPAAILIIAVLIFQFPFNNSVGLDSLIANAGLNRSTKAVAPIIFAPLVAWEGTMDENGNPFDPQGCGGLIQEAETATLSGTFVAMQDETASNGGFVQVPAGLGFRNPQDSTSNYAEFCFTVTEPGIYRLGGYVLAPSQNNDSFYVSINGSPAGDFIWDTIRMDGFSKDFAVPRDGGDDFTVSLNAGDHTVRLFHREPDTRIDAVFLDLVDGGPDVPVPTPAPVAPGPIDSSLPTEATYTLTPGNLNSMWPNLQPGDVVFLDPGEYSGGQITLSVEGTAQNPVHIQKTPGKSGKVVIRGSSSLNHLFNITGAHIHIGGTQIGPGWEPDFVIEGYSFAGIRMRSSANDIRIHHIHFLDIGTHVGGSNGFGVRANGQNVVFEFNRIEDPAADAIQMEGGPNLQNWIVRYNYGSNRLASGQPWAWNAASHADFMQIQVGPARDVQIYGNLMMGYTIALILGDSWGTAANVTIRDNFILFEGNGINSQTKGDVAGTYLIENNTLVMYVVDGVDGGGRSAIYLRDKGAMKM